MIQPERLGSLAYLTDLKMILRAIVNASYETVPMPCSWVRSASGVCEI
jgi:hypothetical protein